MATVTQTQRDYAVTLLSTEVDEDGIPFERYVGVLWDEGVTPDWDEWLKDFNRLQGEEYILLSAVDVTDAPDEF